MTIKYVISWARGIGEPIDNNTCALVARKVQKEVEARTRGVKVKPYVQLHENAWPAQYGHGTSFNEGLKKVKAIQTSIINKNSIEDARHIILGYSGGAAGIGDWLVDQQPETLRQVLAVGLISDPSMPQYIDTQTKLGGERVWGIRGSRTVPILERTKWIYNHNDVICCCPENSPLRTIAEATSDFELGDRTTWGGVLRQLAMGGAFARLSAQLNRNPDRLKAINDRYLQARLDAIGYIGGGEHTSYGVRIDPKSGQIYTDNLVNWLTDRIVADYSARR